MLGQSVEFEASIANVLDGDDSLQIKAGMMGEKG